MSQPAFGSFCWNELATPNLSKAKDFYNKVLGWQFHEIKSDEMTYTIIKSKDKDIAGMWEIPTNMQEEVPPHWMAYILVEDVKEALEKAKQHGAHEVRGITKAGEMGSFAIITDPTGAHLAFWETHSK